MKKTMEWTDPVIIKLSENRGASGAATCQNGGQAGDTCNSGPSEAQQSCDSGWGATYGCDSGIGPTASGTICEFGSLNS